MSRIIGVEIKPAHGLWDCRAAIALTVQLFGVQKDTSYSIEATSLCESWQEVVDWVASLPPKLVAIGEDRDITNASVALLEGRAPKTPPEAPG